MSAETPTPRPTALDVREVRRRLNGKTGPEYWRSLEELAGDEEFRELLEREFPRQAAEWPQGVDRRRFLQLAGASLGLGGLAACTKQPIERLVPYVRQPEEIVPGKPLYFASSFELDGFALPLLVESHMGRPTKVEGNPDHPAGTGATDLFAQASVLDLYDPDRSQVVRRLGRISTWTTFYAETRAALGALDSLGGARVRILTGAVTSPSLAAAIGAFLARYPKARWHRWEPVGRGGEIAGSELAFGEPLATRYDLSRAEVVLALDSDFLVSGPARLRYARDFAALRKVRRGKVAMNRLYAVESAPTASGTLADHRLPLAPSAIVELCRALAAELGMAAGPAPEAFRSGALAEWTRALAADLAAHRGRSVVIPGEGAPAAVHAFAHAVNHRLGNHGVTVFHSDAIEANPVDPVASLGELVADMSAGEVDALLILDANPVYDAPADLGFTEALQKVNRRVRLGAYEDETSAWCHWHLPAAHDLERWGDSRSFDGTVSLLQPLIEPLHGAKSGLEVLSNLLADEPKNDHDLLLDHWRGSELAGLDFERSWRRWLHDGYVPGTAAAARDVRPDESGALAALAAAAGAAAESGGLELIFRPDPTVYDGRFANNGWLQECPKPLTKLTWDNAALLGPALAARLGVTSGELLRIDHDGRSLEAPAWVQPGHPDGAVTLHLGYGRQVSGRVGGGAGFSAYALRTSAGLWSAAGATASATGASYPLASTQMHQNMAQETVEAERRHLVRSASLDHYRDSPDFAQHMGHGGGPSLYPDFEYDGYAWGLAIDLSSCTGCNACVIACQSENNIPVVGKDQVARGREMQWIRIDRYYEGGLDDPTVHHQPVMCMHCEQAPCEVVCPVGATVHSDEGLNEMVYNRCVGTRYCSNNCPYKVRRFNFLLYNDLETESLKMMRNPDVTVRTRGVMEKCTYCVQRISKARIEAEKAARRIGDGEVVTACQQACPTDAIVFGDINDPASRVSQWKAEPLNYGILEELSTRPRTSYLAKLTNPNPALAGAGGADGAEGHG